MKIIASQNNIILATHTDDQLVEHLYPGSIVYFLTDGYRKTDGDSLTVGDSLVNELDIETAKTIRRRFMDDHMDSVRKLGFVCTNEIHIQCQEKDLFRWGQALDIITLANLDSITVRDINDDNHAVAVADFQTMMIKLGVYIQTLLGTAWAKKDMINACSTVPDVFAVTWED